jgi:hypothetical protein
MDASTLIGISDRRMCAVRHNCCNASFGKAYDDSRIRNRNTGLIAHIDGESLI